MAEIGGDFPLLCETCLGPNPYVRMIKLPFGHKLCTISGLSYQAFRWTPAGGRQKETIISYAVAKERNICQTCLNDMQYGLPVGVRDKILAELGKAPQKAPDSIEGARFHYAQVTNGEDTSSSALTLTNADLLQSEAGQKLIRMAQAKAAQEAKNTTSFRNLPKLCSFWVLGTCTRCVKGVCQFRPCCGPASFAFPELARTEKELCKNLIDRLKAEGPIEVMKTLNSETRRALQDSRRGVNTDAAIRDRVSGTDELTEAYIGKMQPKTDGSEVRSKPLEAPADQSICTLWLGNIDENTKESELREALKPAGIFNEIHIARKAKCAFVEYPDRQKADNAAKILHKSMQINGNNVVVNWAKPNPAPKKRSAAGDVDDGDDRGRKKVKK
jgi:pre-mRNA-splicing factor RBM22/SLT11